MTFPHVVTEIVAPSYSPFPKNHHITFPFAFTETFAFVNTWFLHVLLCYIIFCHLVFSVFNIFYFSSVVDLCVTL